MNGVQMRVSHPVKLENSQPILSIAQVFMLRLKLANELTDAENGQVDVPWNHRDYTTTIVVTTDSEDYSALVEKVTKIVNDFLTNL